MNEEARKDIESLIEDLANWEKFYRKRQEYYKGTVAETMEIWSGGVADGYELANAIVQATYELMQRKGVL